MVGHRQDLEGARLAGDGLEGVVKRVLVGPSEGWQGWVLRLFELEPAGHTPRHAHPWPHINYVTGGSGTLHIEGVDHAVTVGSYAYVPAGAVHQFSNAGDDTFAFLCVVPEEGDA